jgi:hypothetical protein
MSVFSLIIALGPVSIYWVLVGYLYLRKKPLVVSASRDTICLGLAMIGMFLIGPAELFFPNAAFNLLGVSVWLFIVMLYLSILLFLVLGTRPRLVVYGLSDEQLLNLLQTHLSKLDHQANFLGKHLVAPTLGIEAVIEPAGFGRVSQLSATSRQQNIQGWAQLERSLAHQLASCVVPSQAIGRWWLALGLGVLLAIFYSLTRNTDAVAQGFKEMLRL